MIDKYCTIGDLLNAFREAGMPISVSWIYRQERKGNLKLPRSTTNFKRPKGFFSGNIPTAVRLIRESQIKEIVEAFLPGGKGYWSFEENE